MTTQQAHSPSSSSASSGNGFGRRRLMVIILAVVGIFVLQFFSGFELTAFMPISDVAEEPQKARIIEEKRPPSKPHPYMGARDVHGNFGYVADVTQVRKWMMERFEKGEQFREPSLSYNNSLFQYLPFNDAKELEDVCGPDPGTVKLESEAGFDLIANHVQVYIEDYQDLENDKEETLSQSTENPAPTRQIPPSKGKILCVVYSYAGKRTLISAVTETWGWRCDGFFSASTETVTNPTPGLGFGQVDLPHMYEESYGTMWQKTRSIIGYLYDNYLDDYDYFYVGGDDTHLIVENLRAYLGVVEAELGTDSFIMIGGSVIMKQRHIIGGGAGYVLNKFTLSKFGREGLDSCENSTKTSAEDRFLSLCLRDLGCKIVDSADEEDRQRFIHFHPNQMAVENPFDIKSWTTKTYKLWEQQGHGRRWGKNATSTRAVSFHKLRNPQKMKRHHAILYRSCPLGTNVGDALAEHDRQRLSNEVKNLSQVFGDVVQDGN